MMIKPERERQRITEGLVGVVEGVLGTREEGGGGKDQSDLYSCLVATRVRRRFTGPTKKDG